MSEEKWESGKAIAYGEALVIATAIVSGVIAANWNGKTTTTEQIRLKGGRPGVSAPRAPLRQAVPIPPASDIETCNAYAKSAPVSHPNDPDKKAEIGSASSAGVGETGEANAEDGSGAGKGAVFGSIIGVTAGSLYGVSDANRRDERAVVAYRACMREHGHTSN